MTFKCRKDRNTVSYLVNGERITLQRDPDYVAVRYKDNVPRSDRHELAGECSNLGDYHGRIEVPGEEYTLIPVAPGKQLPGFNAVKAELFEWEEILCVTPVYKLGNARVIGTHRLTVGFKPKTKYRRQLLKKHGCTIPNRYLRHRIDDEHRVALRDPSGDVFEKAEELSRLDEIEFAVPEMVMVSQQFGLSPPDATGTAATDNRYYLAATSTTDAWKIQTGAPTIKIAVLDVGVDASHPDLGPQLVAAFDTIKDDPFPNVEPVDFHGTACAGLSCGKAATAVGVTGIGNGCSLVAIRIAHTKNGNFSINKNDIVQAIRTAWQDLQVDVLSNSWFFAPDQQIANEFERARTQGRQDSQSNARGCVIVAATGNENTNVDFPARQQGLLAVTATGSDGKVKTPGSHNAAWGANFGPGNQVALGAPGVDLLTTDNVGAAGESPNNYNQSFSGTSAATPLVAGAAGLVLSAAPNLTEQQVREILTTTADAPPGMTVPDKRLGAGVLNVLKAVEAAQSGLQILKGTVHQAGVADGTGTGTVRAGSYFLKLPDGSTVALRTYSNNETSQPIDFLEKKSIAKLAGLVGQTVEIQYTHRLNRPQGSIVWGVTAVSN